MAGSLNKVMIIGNVGRDPELRYTPDGTARTTFSVAVTRVWNSPDGERKEETEWFNIVTFKKLAETCGNYVYKGQKIYVEGRLQTRKYLDSQTQQEKRFVELLANQVLFLSKPKGAVESGGGEESMGTPAAAVDDESGDIPF